MRQAHPELNFRRGRGAIRERRKAFSRNSLEATCKFLGMSQADTEAFLEETDKIRGMACVECGEPLPAPTPDPFRCHKCRRS